MTLRYIHNVEQLHSFLLQMRYKIKAMMIILIAVLLTSCMIFVEGTEPIILTAPTSYTESVDGNLNYGQCACVDPSGRHVAIGANGYANYEGVVFLYTLRRREGQFHQNILRPDDSQKAEQRSKELRPHGRGSGFGFSCAFPASTSITGRSQFGRASFIIIGAPGHDVQRGAAYVFASTNGSDLHADWSLVSKLVAHPVRRSGDLFGWSVAVDRGCETVAISARGHQANNGQVLIFACESECKSCHVVSTLHAPDYTDTIGPRGIRIRNNFGASVAISADGKTIVIGSTGFDQERGAAYVYRYTNANTDPRNDSWTLSQRLEAPGNKTFSYFGYKVAMDASANVIVVGADGEDDYKGAAYVFRKHGGMFKLETDLRATSAVPEDNFGGSVSISGNGAVIAVGAPGTDHEDLTDHGILYLYRQENLRKGHNDGLQWQQFKTIKLPMSLRKQGTQFAWDVAISANANLVAVTASDAPNHNSGVATLFNFHHTQVSNRTDHEWKDEL